MGAKRRDSATEVRVALAALNARVAAGEEYPDAEERVARFYRLTDREIKAVRAAYDSQ